MRIAEAEGRAELASVGAQDWSPRLLEAIFWDWVELNGPHVDGGARTVAEERLSETNGLADNYLTWLLRSGIDALRDETYPGGRPPHALLYLVLRHAVLRALLRAAESAATTDIPELTRRVAMPAATTAWREPELIDIGGSAATTVVWEHARTRVSRGTENTTAGGLAEAVYHAGAGVSPSAQPLPAAAAFAELHELGAALAHLESRPTAALERAFAQTLDLGSHRLDAWITSLATKRLFELRHAGVEGICIGAYGWLEQLHARRGGGQPELPVGSDPTRIPATWASCTRPRQARRPLRPCFAPARARTRARTATCSASTSRPLACAWPRRSSTASARDSRWAPCSATASSARCTTRTKRTRHSSSTASSCRSGNSLRSRPGSAIRPTPARSRRSRRRTWWTACAHQTS